MRSEKASSFVEEYLYGARGHRALAQSVFAEGERRGFSERRLRRATSMLGVIVSAGCWELSALRVEAIDARQVLSLSTWPAATERPLAVAPAARRVA